MELSAFVVLAVFSPGPLEIAVIVGVMVLLFGKRLPDVGRSLGKGIVEFKKGVKGVDDQLKDVDHQVAEQKRLQDAQAQPVAGEAPAAAATPPSTKADTGDPSA